MCQLCLDSIQEHWPDLTPTERSELLWGATCFPFGCGKQIATQVRELAEWTGRNLEKAMCLAEMKMDFAVVNNWRWIWPRQYVGVSDFDLR